MKEYIYKKVLKAYSELEKKEVRLAAEKEADELLSALQTELINEMYDMQNDPILFIEKYCKLIHPVKGLIPVVLFPHQKELLTAYDDNRCNIVYGARRTGISLTNALYALHDAFFNSFKTIIVASDTLRSAACTLDDIRIAYDCLPEFYKDSNRMLINNKHEISFENSSRIMAMPINDYATRGISASLIIADNYTHASNKNQTHFYMSASLSILDHGKFIITSSGGMEVSMFSELWFDSVVGLSKFTPHWIQWNINGRGDTWKEKIINQIGEKQWKAEYEAPVTFKDEPKWQEQKTQD